MAENDKNIKFNFTLSARGDSPYWSLVKYYQKLDGLESRQLILEAAGAFWSPLAARAREMKGEALRCLVTDCLYRLRRQEKEIASQFRVVEEGATGEPLLVAQTREPVSFEFAYRVYDACQFPLVRYLMDSQGTFSLSQKVLWSSRAFWGASAEREVGQGTAEQLSQSASYCLGCLRDHIDYLKNYFEYWEIDDRIAASASGTAAPRLAATSPLPPLLEEEETEEETKVMSDEEMEQWLRHDPENDGWRSNLFN